MSFIIWACLVISCQWDIAEQVLHQFLHMVNMSTLYLKEEMRTLDVKFYFKEVIKFFQANFVIKDNFSHIKHNILKTSLLSILQEINLYKPIFSHQSDSV